MTNSTGRWSGPTPDALSQVMPDVPLGSYIRALMAWTHIFGFLNFELFGHCRGSVRNANAMFDAVVDELAEFLGLTD